MTKKPPCPECKDKGYLEYEDDYGLYIRNPCPKCNKGEVRGWNLHKKMRRIN